MSRLFLSQTKLRGSACLKLILIIMLADKVYQITRKYKLVPKQILSRFYWQYTDNLSKMDKTIKNKIVLVTGGATGIGLSIVDYFLENGAKLAIIVDINEELGAKAIESMTTKHGDNKAVFFKGDVTSDLDVIYEKIVGKYKSIDVLINNAGILNENLIKSTININLTSLMEWSIKFYDYMRQDRGGHGGTIINVASIYGLRTTPYLPCYHASKFGVIGFSKSLGHEYNFKKTGVRVVAVCPGYTYSLMTANIGLKDGAGDDVVEDFTKETKSNEWQEVDAVGKGVIELVKKAESGTVWVVEGNRSAVMVKD